jgi:hypothetical protein
MPRKIAPEYADFSANCIFGQLIKDGFSVFW